MQNGYFCFARSKLKQLVNGMPHSIVLELLIRVVMATVFGLLQHVPPRARDIHPEELWLYRNRPSAPYFPSWCVVIIVTVVVPAFIFLLQQQQQQQQFDSEEPFINHSKNVTTCQLIFLGYSLSILLTGIVTDSVKLIVGRPRPDFYYRCFPAGDSAAVASAAAAAAALADAMDDGPAEVAPQPAPHSLVPLLLLPSACTGDPATVAEGRKSFPSGHASMSFASLGYLSLLLADRLLFWSPAPSTAWRLLACLAPSLAAGGIALSRLADFHHHAEDVLTGSVLGLLAAFACHRCYRPMMFAEDSARASGSGCDGRRIDV